MSWGCSPADDVAPADARDADTDRTPEAAEAEIADEAAPHDAPDAEGDASSTGCSAIDLVFVLDRSTSMQEERDNLVANFPRFIELLEGFRLDGVPIDYRVAVTDDTVTHVERNLYGSAVKPGTDGAFLTGRGCGLDRPWIARGDPDVAGRFACVADIELGDAVTVFEMPLGALEQALTTQMRPGGANEGFLRGDALLAAVLITDEDDHTAATIPTDEADDGCPVTAPYCRPVPEFVGVLDAVKGDRQRWAVAVIAGPGPGDCASAFGQACEAHRLREFVDLGGERAVFGSICADDLAAALEAALDRFRAACETFLL